MEFRSVPDTQIQRDAAAILDSIPGFPDQPRLLNRSLRSRSAESSMPSLSLTAPARKQTPFDRRIEGVCALRSYIPVLFGTGWA